MKKIFSQEMDRDLSLCAQVSAAAYLYPLNQEQKGMHKAHCTVSLTWTDTSIKIMFRFVEVTTSYLDIVEQA